MKNYFLISIFSILSVFLIGCLDEGEETSVVDKSKDTLTYKVISSIDCQGEVYTLSVSVKESAETGNLAHRLEDSSKKSFCFTQSGSAFCQTKFNNIKEKNGCKVLVDNTESTS